MSGNNPSFVWFKRVGIPVILGLLIFYFWPSDITRVEKNTRKLLAAISKNGPESLPVSAARTHTAISYLSSNIVLKLGEPFPDNLHKSDAGALLQQARMRTTRMMVKSLGHQIDRHEDGDIWMDITLDANVEVQDRREEIIGTYRLTWGKIDNEWKIKKAEMVEVIKHPSGDDGLY